MRVIPWGDPLECHYKWIEPDEIDRHGESIRALGNKLESACTALETTATLPEDTFAGEAADTLQRRAGTRATEATDLRANLRGVGRAVQEYAESLKRYRLALGDLRDLATSRGLELRDHQIWAPVATIASDASKEAYAAWEGAWKAYEACYELKHDIERARNDEGHALSQAMTDFTGVRPTKDGIVGGLGGHGQVDFGGQGGHGGESRGHFVEEKTSVSELRREAAEEARDAIEAQEALEVTQATVATLRDKHDAALDELQRLAYANAPYEELLAQSEKVALVTDQWRAAQDEAGEHAQVVDSERSQSNQAARDLRDRLG